MSNATQAWCNRTTSHSRTRWVSNGVPSSTSCDRFDRQEVAGAPGGSRIHANLAFRAVPRGRINNFIPNKINKRKHSMNPRQYRPKATTWPQTDCDKLDAAFAELERKGIVARQNLACCTNCGSKDIRDEMELLSRRGQAVRGGTFYHAQDTEAVVEGQGIHLAYCALEEGEDCALEIAREIVATIMRHGLPVMWDGKCETRIFVRMDWKRRIRA